MGSEIVLFLKLFLVVVVALGVGEVLVAFFSINEKGAKSGNRRKVKNK